MSEVRSRKQPIDFRKEEVTYVMQRWRAGDSVALIGTGSVGKSNLLQHLADEDVQRAYMELTSTSQFQTILLDPNLLGPLPQGDDAEAQQFRCWAGYELIMHRLVPAFRSLESVDAAESQRFSEIYRALQDGTNPLFAYLGLRYLELAIDFFTRRGVRLVFMFDEFEDMLQYMPVKFFQSLRGLRDANKRQLSYLTFSRLPLNVLVDRYNIAEDAIQSFVELFTDNVHYVGPYNDTDARRMIQELQDRNKKAYSNSQVEFLLKSSGRYAGLLRSLFRLLDTVSVDSDDAQDAALAQLIKRRAVQQEARTIWTSLTPTEQHVLRAVAGYTGYETNAETEQAVAMLVQKRLLHVDRDEQKLYIQPPLFELYVKADSQKSA